ncbi:lantibiotic dehydratase [Paracoccus onubensis]|uniref:Uncharacterized protein n=1 Tax=Paracoccus onubensis TaxID=1675788 RepID=A0A418SY40_9RHOB|nr:lantibiotic dehydratase [Paracoccus onubensis]RJE85825.1 hypothetical protein D3P04_08715 [Paracoccus onubensis]
MNIDTRTLQRQTAADDRAGRIAPFAVLRAATLPFDAIQALRLPETEQLLARIASAEQEMEAMREQVERVLHELVPGLEDDRKLRRHVVNLKRDVHNGRGSRLKHGALMSIAELIHGEKDRGAFDMWCRAAESHANAGIALEETIARETQDVLRPALRDALKVPHFARAVALASPRTAKSAAREKKLPRTAWPDKLERSLLGYIARASVKTSPFSSFMSVSTLGVDAMAAVAPPSAASADFESFATVNRGLAAQLERLSREKAARSGSAMPLTVNSTLRPVNNGRFVALCNDDITMAGRGWSEQRLAQFRLGGPLGQVLAPGLSDHWQGWVRRLTGAGIPEQDADRMIALFLARGVLTAPPVFDLFTGNPLQALADHWRSCDLAELDGAAEELDALTVSLDDFGAAEGPHRLSCIARAEEAAAKLRDRLSTQARAPETLTNLITEDCWLNSTDGTLGADLMGPLADLEDFLASQVAIAPAYSALVKSFIANFGAGGTCGTVVEFLTGAAPHLVDIPEFGARLEEATPDAAPEGAHIPVTAHFQIAQGGANGTEFVMNRVFDGAGWLASRFTQSDHPQAARLARSLGGWLAVVAEGAEPVDLPVAGQASDLQAHREITHRVLGWPGEPLTLTPDRILDPASLQLRHDPATNFLSLTDADGRAVSLQYLGNTFPNPSWGVRYALSILSRPFVVARPSIDAPSLASGEPVHFRPARRHGQVVLSRAAWWISSAYLRECWLDGTPAEQLLATARDIERLGLPRQFYAQIHVPMQNASLLVSRDVLDANRKPIWVDTRNPFWLAMLERLTRKSDWVVLSPPCPGPDTLWFEVAGRKHVTEIHLEMLVRAGKRRQGSF